LDRQESLRTRIEVLDAAVERAHVVDERDLEVQAGFVVAADDLAEAELDRPFALVDGEQRVQDEHERHDDAEQQAGGQSLHHGFLERALSRERASEDGCVGVERTVPSDGTGCGRMSPRISWSSGKYIRLPLLSVSISTLRLAPSTDSIVSR